MSCEYKCHFISRSSLWWSLSWRKCWRRGYGDVTNFLEYNEAQVFSCSYDSGNDVGGFVIKRSPDYWFSEIDLETLSDKIEKAKKDFFELTGQEGKLILTTYGR